MFVNTALLRLTPVKSVFEISVSVKSAVSIFTRGPIMYAPVCAETIRRYGGVSIVLVLISRAAYPTSCSVRAFVKFTFVRFTPTTFVVGGKYVFAKFAPLKSIFGPII